MGLLDSYGSFLKTLGGFPELFDEREQTINPEMVLDRMTQDIGPTSSKVQDKRGLRGRIRGGDFIQRMADVQGEFEPRPNWEKFVVPMPPRPTPSDVAGGDLAIEFEGGIGAQLLEDSSAEGILRHLMDTMYKNKTGKHGLPPPWTRRY